MSVLPLAVAATAVVNNMGSLRLRGYAIQVQQNEVGPKENLAPLPDKPYVFKHNESFVDRWGKRWHAWKCGYCGCVRLEVPLASKPWFCDELCKLRYQTAPIKPDVPIEGENKCL